MLVPVIVPFAPEVFTPTDVVIEADAALLAASTDEPERIAD